MDKLSKYLLNKIANRLNKNTELIPTCDILISETRFKDYHFNTQAEREECHAVLALLQREEWLYVEYKQRGFSELQLIERIEIKDSRKLLKALGLTVKADVTSNAISQLTSMKSEISKTSALVSLIELAICNIAKGRSAYNCKPNEIDTLIASFKAVNWLLDKTNMSGVIDYRTFSVRFFGDTKVFERKCACLLALLKVITPDELEGANATEILDYWGISRFPPSIKMSGNLMITTNKGTLEIQNAWPFIEVPAEGIQNIQESGHIDYVLFIENKTTFERYTREVSDHGIIIYTNGFPSSSWQRVVKLLGMRLSKDTHFYHWGDIDAGGFKIFCFIQSLINRNLIAFKMDEFSPITNSGKNKSSIQLKTIKEILSNVNFDGARQLLDSFNDLSDDTQLQQVEQEAQLITSPMELT